MKWITLFTLLSCFLTFGCASSSIAESIQPEKLQIGTYKSRAIFTKAVDSSNSAKRPLVILIPGSGPNGPESFMGPDVTLDRQFHPLLTEFAKPLTEAGFHTLQLGKPGIDFGYNPDGSVPFYDIELTKSINWNDLILNLKEAVDYARTRPDVDSDRIFVLGHSQGTQVAVDYASKYNNISGLILLGFSNDDIKTLTDWQLFQRVFDCLIIPDIDTNHDGIITSEEANKFPGLQLGLSETKSSITIKEMQQTQRSDKNLQNMFNATITLPATKDIFDRGPLIPFVLKLNVPIFVFNGTEDVQTRPEGSIDLATAAKQLNKDNIHVTLVNGLGHGFSEPRPPRKQKLLDLTIGPVDPKFQKMLFELGQSLIRNK